jgi:DNA repair exonuclease SbcCD ATPase subunit
MSDKKKVCPVCANQLDPAKAERTIELYEATLLTSEAYRAAFHGASAATRNNILEYEMQSEKLDKLLNRVIEIHRKYRE